MNKKERRRLLALQAIKRKRAAKTVAPPVKDGWVWVPRPRPEPEALQLDRATLKRELRR